MVRRLVLISCLLIAHSAGAETIFPISTSGELEDLLRNQGGDSVPDGGIIEMAPGTYVAPTDGFLIFNPNRSFTIRAAIPGTVFLDGGDNRRIIRFIVNNPDLGGAVVFEGLTFRRGFSNQPAFGSAITMQGAFATFIDCLFEDNHNRSNGSGSGTVGVQLGTTALFLRTIVRDNTSKTSGAGAVVVKNSTMFCHECQFLRNRNNVPDHIPTATGAGMVITSESSVYLSNSRFAANKAGFGGGAIDAKGSFEEPNPVLVVSANSTFVDNGSAAAPGVTTGSPAAGGAFNVEDHAIARFYNSRLIDNDAQFGGAIAVYRATVEVYDSVLRGNFATGRESSNSAPRGGAIFAVSDDTAVDGTSNRPTSRVVVRDTLIHGLVTAERAGSQTAGAHTGGCIYTSGDLFRHLGLGGVPQGGTQAQNSARLDIDRTALVDCNVEAVIADGALGGGLFSELAIITVDDSLFVDGNANGTFGAGGAAALTRYANAKFKNTTFANNFAVRAGGALFMLGAEIDIDSCTFIENIVPGGNPTASKGAAIFTGPQPGAELGIEGIVHNSTFIDHHGLPIFEDDRECPEDLFNLVTYENNDFYETMFAPHIYHHAKAGSYNPNGLNDLVIVRGGNCPVTNKAEFDTNERLTTEPVAGALLETPPQILGRTAAGDPVQTTESFLTYAWYGACAELNGFDLANGTGLFGVDTGVHGLMVFDNAQCSGAPDLDLDATIVQGLTPSAHLTADPIAIESGEWSNLIWQTAQGTFLESAIDQGLGVRGAADGTAWVRPPLTTTYTFFTVTEEGGATDSVKVYVDMEPDLGLIFADGFESGDTSAW